MGVILDSWCFCKGVSKTEKMKASIFSSKASAMALISLSGSNGVTTTGTGFLIHRNLLLTTHLNLPSISATESAEVRLQNGVSAALFPHRFFITSSVIDLTIVGIDIVDGGDSNSQSQTQHQPHYLKTCSKPNLDLGSVVYLLGYAAQNELKIGEGKLVVATDNLVKLSTDEMVWSPGSAGFDVQGNLAFMICDPRKLATSPASTSTSSTSSLKRDNNKSTMMQFGIPIPVICDWLNQHWEGSLDEHSTKPKLPLIRLMSTGQRSERSCTSFTMRRVFKANDSADVGTGTPSSSNTRDHQTHSTAAEEEEEKEEETSKNIPQVGTSTNTHAQGIPTPEIYESPKLTSGPLKKESVVGPVHLLDINFPPRIPKVTNLLPQLNSPPSNLAVEEAEIASEESTGSINGDLSEVISSSPPAQPHHYVYNNQGYSSEEETMYSAETAESRNYPTPPKKPEFHHERNVGRSQSCVSSSRWGTPQKSLSGRREMLEKQRSFVHGKKMMHSQGATSQRSNDYYSPTVSSIMKKRINSAEPKKIFKSVPRPRAVSSSPRWMF